MDRVNAAFQIRSAIVNGCTGVIGSMLVQKLLEAGIEVYAVVRPNSQRIASIPQGAHIIQCDLKNTSQLPGMINQHIDAYFHLAWEGTSGSARDDMEIQTRNIYHAIEAVEACIRMNVQVFVGVGSQAEHGYINGPITSTTPCNPLSGYGMAKLCAGMMTRKLCMVNGIRHEWVRVLSVYGPNDNPNSLFPSLIRSLQRREIPALTEGRQMWDFIFSEDAASALIAIAERGGDGKIYPLGSGKVRPLREYCEIVKQQIAPDIELTYGAIPYSESQIMHLQADIDDLVKDTGFEPKLNFIEGIMRTVEYYKS